MGILNGLFGNKNCNRGEVSNEMEGDSLLFFFLLLVILFCNSGCFDEDNSSLLFFFLLLVILFCDCFGNDEGIGAS
jgi:hypothetical protein